MKTIEEQIKIIQHFANGGEVEILTKDQWNLINNSDFSNWNFELYDFRIKETKKTVTIEKWLLTYLNKHDDFIIIEGTLKYIDTYLKHSSYRKVKLLKTYEVEL